jgi:quinone-modifying oxidoreductase subunit QmoC
MMALRRFAIRRYSIGRLADTFYSAFSSGMAWVVLTAVAIALVAAFRSPSPDLAKTDFLSYISLERIHVAGIAIVSLIALAFLMNLGAMYRAVRQGPHRAAFSLANLKASSVRALREAAFQSRFRECEDNKFRRWAHLLVSWGFAGMFLATAVIGAVDFKWVPLPRWVSLVIGSAGGAATLVGLGYYIFLRFGRKTQYAKYSHQTDWAFLILLTLCVMSGYVMVAFRFLGMPGAAYDAFAIHLVIVFNFLVSLPFTKFAHVVYRPIALWLAGVK